MRIAALRFLRYFLMANYVIKNARGDAVVREDEIYDWFVDKDNAALCDYANKPFEFVRKVIRNVEHYLAFGNGLGNDGKPSLAVDSLKRLAGGAFSLHYVLLPAAANFPKALFEHFVTQLESFLFYYIFTKTPTKDLERNFSLWADELRTIAGMTDPVKQRAALNAFVADRFEKNMAAKSQVGRQPASNTVNSVPLRCCGEKRTPWSRLFAYQPLKHLIGWMPTNS